MSSKIIKSVVLLPGESFTLPPNSRLIGSSDITSLESTCDIPDLETIECFTAVVMTAGNEGTSTQPYEAGAASLVGFRFNGVETLFASPYVADAGGNFSKPTLLAELKTLLPAISDTVSGSFTDAATGSVSYFLIVTTASVANSLELLYKSSAPISALNPTTIARVPFQEHAVVAAVTQYANVPTCPITLA